MVSSFPARTRWRRKRHSSLLMEATLVLSTTELTFFEGSFFLSGFWNRMCLL